MNSASVGPCQISAWQTIPDVGRHRTVMIHTAFVLTLLASALMAACVPIQAQSDLRPATGTLTPAELYAAIAPAVVYIETPLGTGSGLVISLAGDSYILTNEHVLWPDLQARVAFPDGTELTDVPLAAADRMIDLALLGPVESPVAPVAIARAENAQIGDEVYLIGYPAEGELFPVPSLARGLVSRTREWAGGLTYIQTDAAVAGGQSGGVLVNDRGEVIGLSGLSFGDGAFALAASSADLAPRLEIMASEPYPDGLADREVPSTGRLREYAGRLQNLWHTVTAVIMTEAGDQIKADVDGRNDLALRLLDVDGSEIASVDEESSGTEKLTATVEASGPVFLVVEQYDTTPARFTLHSNRRFAIMDDPDDLKKLTIGETTIGRLDYAGDVDVFALELSAGDSVQVDVDSVMADPYLDIMPRDASRSGFEHDDDSGRGIFGTNSQLVYKARDDGTYLVVVSDSMGEDMGGYQVTATEAKP